MIFKHILVCKYAVQQLEFITFPPYFLKIAKNIPLLVDDNPNDYRRYISNILACCKIDNFKIT